MFTFHRPLRFSVSLYLFIFLFFGFLILPSHANSQTVVTGCAGGDFADECSLAEFNSGASISIDSVKFSFSTQVFPNPADGFGTDPSQVKVTPLTGAPGPGLRIEPNSGVWSADGNGTLFGASKSSQTYIFFALPVDGITSLDIVDVHYNVESTTTYPAAGDPLCASGDANAAGGHVEGTFSAVPAFGGASLGGANYAAPQAFVDDVNTSAGVEIYRPAQGSFSFAEQFGVQLLHTFHAIDCGTLNVNSAEITAYEIRVVPSTLPPVAPGNDVLGNLPGTGLMVFENDNTSSVVLHTDTAVAIAVGDVDDSGIDDVIASFLPGTGPGGTGGTFISRDQGALVLLDARVAQMISVGNFDGLNGDDLLIDFAVDGLTTYFNDTVMTPFAPVSAVDMAVGDVDGNGEDDAVVSVTGVGTVLLPGLSIPSAVLLDGDAASVLETADVDGNGWDDIVASFASGTGPGGTGGVFIARNQAPFAFLTTTLVALQMTSGDFDGSGQDDVAFDFGGTTGVVIYLNDSSVMVLGPVPLVAMTSGDVDNTGLDDLIVSVVGAGTAVFKDLTTVEIWDPTPALHLDGGNIDGN